MCMDHALLAEDPAPTAEADPAVEAFAQKLMATANGAASALMISIGHRTGLFDAMAGAGRLDSPTLAARAGLDERYVREWLGAMATARIVEIDPDGTRFALPDAHAALLASDAPMSLANVFQFIAVLGGVETGIVECFRRGGGLSYDAYDRFHEVMAAESDQTAVAALAPHILPLVPGLSDRLQRGIAVADIGCGEGRALLLLAALFPASRFTGYDLCADTIERARTDAAAKGLANVAFEQVDATRLPEGAFDCIFTFDAIHDQAHPDRVLANIRRALNPGGVYIMQEIDAQTGVANNLDHPMGPWVYTISCMHCMSVSLGQGGQGLGAAWGEQLAADHLAAAGFGRVERQRLPHDPLNLYFVARA